MARLAPSIASRMRDAPPASFSRARSRRATGRRSGGCCCRARDGPVPPRLRAPCTRPDRRSMACSRTLRAWVTSKRGCGRTRRSACCAMSRRGPSSSRKVLPASIAICGFLEAASVTFDALWVAGLSSQQWPPPPRPNPLLPVAWQRERGVPRSSAARELSYARGLTERLARCSPIVVMSAPAVLDDYRRAVVTGRG